MKEIEHNMGDVLPAKEISNAIVVLRGQRVILDRELAAIYGVPTKRLNEQVRRNIERFPPDFMFQVTDEEAKLSRSQFATLNVRRGSAFADLEKKVLGMDEKNQRQFREVYAAIKALTNPPATHRRPIGFTADIDSLS